MGSPWHGGRNDGETVTSDSLAPTGPIGGLEASELDMLRHMPDYDAEEMATVRPAGGWPAVAPPPAAAFQPASPLATATIWSPPNAVEPPAIPTWSPSNQVTPPAGWTPPSPVTPPAWPPVPSTAAPAVVQHRFPEERTVALMAEDLLGRPLDAPPPVQPSPAGGEPQVDEADLPIPSHDLPAARAPKPTTDDSNLWDQVMPLYSER